MKRGTSFAQLIGKAIKDYHLEEMVQQQPYMAMFLARRTGTGEACLLRLFTLPEEISTQERLILLGQVQQEVSRIAALQHRAIQPIIEYGHEQGMTYLVTPFISACSTLADVLSTQGPLDLIQTGSNLKLLASALEYAHKHAIVHGKLTASSIIVYSSVRENNYSSYGHERIMITDIGIARLQALVEWGSSRQSSLHSPHTYGHERLPRAEQSLGRPMESMTDIAALGALVYQMLTAHEVFTYELQEPGKQPQISPLSTWRLDLPTELDAVINRALTNDPAAGYQSLSVLVDAYHQVAMPGSSTHNPSQTDEQPFVLEQAVSAQKHETDAANVPALSRPFARRKLTVALAAAGAGVVVVGGGWLFLQPQQGSQGAQGTTPVATSEQQKTVPQQSTNNRTVIARTTDLPVNRASKFTIPSTADPGLLIHLPDGRFVAFDATCTHQGCQVSYNSTSKQLECPCHSAVFDPARNAAVVAGPAPSPLASVSIHVNADGTITV